jgi:serine/threonine-protein kinase
MPLRAALGLARQIAAGLQAVHELGLVYGDLRPQTVLIDTKGEAKLTSFGGMAVADPMYDAAPLAKYAGLARSQEERVQDARSDIYSFGALLYQLLVGRPTFDMLTCRPLTTPLQPPIELRPEIGPELNAIVLRCLMSNPAERYQDATALLADLERLGKQEGAAQIA